MNAANISYQTSNVCAVVSSLEQPWLAFSPSTICKPLQKYLIRLPELQFDGTRFKFKCPLELTLYREDGGWSCELPPSIIAFGDTPEASVHSFAEDITVLWDEIAQASDDELSPEAQSLKRFLLSAVESVEER